MASSVGERINLRRTEKGMSVAELAEKVGISRGYLHSLENGTTKSPSAEVLYNIAVELSTTIEDLLNKEELVSNYPDIPPQLDEFMTTRNIPEEDIQMLANINIRLGGRRPRTVEEWALIYEIIRHTLR